MKKNTSANQTSAASHCTVAQASRGHLGLAPSVKTLFVVLVVCAGFVVARAQEAKRAASSGADVRTVATKQLPPLNGETLTATILEVTYPPGRSSPAHTHPCPVIGYVLSGALKTQVKGEAEHIYRTGQSFYEAAHGVHIVSANANTSQPTTFLAYFICDHKTELSLPPNGDAEEKK